MPMPIANEAVALSAKSLPVREPNRAGSANEVPQPAFVWSRGGDNRSSDHEAATRRLLGAPATRPAVLPAERGIVSPHRTVASAARTQEAQISAKVQCRVGAVMEQLDDPRFGRVDILAPEYDLSACEIEALTASLRAKYGQRLEVLWSEVRGTSGATYDNLQYRLVPPRSVAGAPGRGSVQGEPARCRDQGHRRERWRGMARRCA